MTDKRSNLTEEDQIRLAQAVTDFSENFNVIAPMISHSLTILSESAINLMKAFDDILRAMEDLDTEEDADADEDA